MPTLQESLQVLNFFRSIREAGERKQAQEKQFAFEQMKARAQQQQRKWEFTINKMASYMDSLGEGPSKDLARERLEGYRGALPQWGQQAVAPFFTKVFPPEKEKAMQFVKVMGPPPEVIEEDATKNPQRYGAQLLDRLVYQHKYQKAQGIESEYPESVPVNEKVYAYRKKGSLVTRLIDLDEERWDEIGSALPGSPTKSALAAAGFQWPLRTQTFKSGPDTYEVTTTKNLLPGATFNHTYVTQQKVFTDEAVDAPTPPGPVTKFAGFFAAWDDDDETKKDPMGRHFVRYKGLVDKGISPNDALRRTIGQVAPEWNFTVVDPGVFETGFFSDSYAQGEKEYLAYWPGVPKGFPSSEEGKAHRWYFDESTGLVYNGIGIRIGTSEEALSLAARTPVRER